MAGAREQIVFWIAASVCGAWCVLQLDAVSIALRSGTLAPVLLAHVLAVGVGASFGLVLFALGRALLALGDALAGLARRLGGPVLSPDVPLIAFGTVAGSYALMPAHREFSHHPATTVLLMAYLPFPLAGVLTLSALVFRRQRFRIPSVVLAAIAVFALHAMNVWYYPGLYRPLHEALTGVGLAASVIAAAVALNGVKTHVLTRGLLIALAAAALVAPFSSRASLRTLAFFDGTQLQHVLGWVERAFDRDGDGAHAGLGGDCDDARSDVGPLRLERAGNGRDDNCRLGERRSLEIAVSARHASPPSSLAQWRAAHAQPNIVLLFVDTLRADFVGALGSKRGLTPEIDDFASSATVFEQARTTMPRTAPALVSLFRARFLSRNLHCRRVLVAGEPSLPQQLAAAGYTVAARLVGKNWLGTPQAEGWGQVLQEGNFNQVTGGEVTDDGRALLDELPRPFVLLLQYVDPHSPYRAASEIPRRGTGIAAEYGAEVMSTDREIGRFLRGLHEAGRSEDTIVVVFSDHGENLGERGSRGGHHGVSLYDEDVRVPLLIHVPGVPAQRVHAPVSIVDIAPTLLDLAGAPPLEGADGRSLVGYVLGAPPESSWTLSEYYEHPSYLRAVVRDHFKLIVDVGNNVHRLFDLRADPGEQIDVAAAHRDRVAQMLGELDRFIETRADPSDPNPASCRQ